MNALKTVVMLAFLGAVGYVVYLSITKNPRHAPDSAAANPWPATPKSQLTAPGAFGPQRPAASSPEATAPRGSLSSAGGTLPPSPPTAPPLLGGRPEGIAATDPGPRQLAPPPGTPALGTTPSSTVPAGAATGFAPPSATPPGADPYRVTTPPSGTPPYAPASPAAPTSPSMADRVAPSPAPTSTPATTVADSPFNDPEYMAQYQSLMQAVRQRLDEGKYEDGLRVLTQLYEMPTLPREQAREVSELLGQVAGTVFYSRQSILFPPHRVQPGETLEQIAATYQMPKELLMKINGLPRASALQPGQELKVVKGPFEAVVNLSRGELVLYVRHYYAGRFPITVGRDQPQLDGEYGVSKKIPSPVYVGPDGARAEPNDPNNPFGRYMIELGKGVAIHGQSASPVGSNGRGTIALGDRDIEDVFSILSVGSKVTIVR